MPQDLVPGSYGLRLQPDAVWEPGAATSSWSQVEAGAACPGARGEVERGDLLPMLHRELSADLAAVADRMEYPQVVPNERR